MAHLVLLKQSWPAISLQQFLFSLQVVIDRHRQTCTIPLQPAHHPSCTLGPSTVGSGARWMSRYRPRSVGGSPAATGTCTAEAHGRRRTWPSSRRWEYLISRFRCCRRLAVYAVDTSPDSRNQETTSSSTKKPKVCLDPIHRRPNHSCCRLYCLPSTSHAHPLSASRRRRGCVTES